jgi:UDP-galactopyranose mutase
LPASLLARLPVRYNFNDFYFNDLHEGLPLDGYHGIFARIFSNPLIDVLTKCDYFTVRAALNPMAFVVYTGPIDRYFEYCFGRLAWRTLDFEIERRSVEDYQGAAVVNYPDINIPFTRIHEFRHLHPERRYTKKQTLIMREFSRFANGDDEPYYPINTSEDKRIYDLYAGRAADTVRVIFGGRLGTYRYLDMHQAIGAALKAFGAELVPMITKEKEV